MKRFLRILTIVSIGLILIYLIYVLGETVVRSLQARMFIYDILMQMLSISVSFGSLLFHIKKLRPKYESVETESALDEDLTKDEQAEAKIPGILKFANGLFGIWGGATAFFLIGTLGTIDDNVEFSYRLLLLLLVSIFFAYTSLYIVIGGIIKFFTPSKSSPAEQTLKE